MSQVVGGDDSELTTKIMIRFALFERRGHAGLMQGFEHLQRIEHGTHAHVVRYAAIDEMEERAIDAIGKGFLGLERSDRSSGGSRRVVGIDEHLH